MLRLNPVRVAQVRDFNRNIYNSLRSPERTNGEVKNENQSPTADQSQQDNISVRNGLDLNNSPIGDNPPHNHSVVCIALECKQTSANL